MTRLRSRGLTRVFYVPQMHATDCGAACVSAISRYFGRPISLRTARSFCRTGRDGSSAGDLARGSRRLGLAVDSYRLAADQIDQDMLPAIAHLGGDHFVVVERVAGDAVLVMDPALGHRPIPMTTFASEFTGILLSLAPGDSTESEVPLQPRRLPNIMAMYRVLLRRMSFRLGVAMTLTAFLYLFLLLTPLVVVTLASPTKFTWSGLLLVLPAAALAFGVLTLCRSRLLLNVKIDHDRFVTGRLVEHLVGLDLTYFQSRSNADLLTRLQSTAAIRDAISAAAVTSIVDAVVAVVGLLLLSIISPVVGAVALLLGSVLMVAPVVAYRWSRPHALTHLGRRSEGSSHLLMLLIGIEQAKAHSAERAIVDAWRDVYEEELGAARRLGGIELSVQTLTEGCRILAGPVLLLVAYATADSTAGAIGLGLSASAFLGPVSSLTRTVASLVAAQAHLLRIEDVLDEPGKPAEAPVLHRGPVTLSVSGVSYTYPGASAPAVEGASFDVLPGETIVIAGMSGSGKSTLARMIAALLPPDAGEVRFVDERGVPVRPALGYVAQSIALFPGTLASNITFGRAAEPEDIADAVEAAALTKFVASLRLGLGTPVVDAGHAFSGGQRQRLAIARAMLHRPPVLVLDEATSNLDLPTTQAILARLAALPATKVVVAHGLRTLAFADKVVYMENGRVVAVGRHDELLSVQAYADYWDEADDLRALELN